MYPTTEDTRFSAGALDALDFFAPGADLTVVDLLEHTSPDETPLFCTFCFVTADTATLA